MTLAEALWFQGLILTLTAALLAVGFTSAIKETVRRRTSAALLVTFSLAVLSGLAAIWTAFVGL